MELTFETLRAVNVERCNAAFFPLDHWSPADWATAMTGEFGEACNLIKKLRRFADSDTQFNKTRTNGHSMDSAVTCAACGDLDGCHVPAKERRERETINTDIGKELADIVIYADLLAARLGIALGRAVAEKFDEVSERVGSPLRLNNGEAVMP